MRVKRDALHQEWHCFKNANVSVSIPQPAASTKRAGTRERAHEHPDLHALVSSWQQPSQCWSARLLATQAATKPPSTDLLHPAPWEEALKQEGQGVGASLGCRPGRHADHVSRECLKNAGEARASYRRCASARPAPPRQPRSETRIAHRQDAHPHSLETHHPSGSQEESLPPHACGHLHLRAQAGPEQRQPRRRRHHRCNFAGPQVRVDEQVRQRVRGWLRWIESRTPSALLRHRAQSGDTIITLSHHDTLPVCTAYAGLECEESRRQTQERSTEDRRVDRLQASCCKQTRIGMQHTKTTHCNLGTCRSRKAPTPKPDTSRPPSAKKASNSACNLRTLPSIQATSPSCVYPGATMPPASRRLLPHSPFA